MNIYHLHFRLRLGCDRGMCASCESSASDKAAPRTLRKRRRKHGRAARFVSRLQERLHRRRICGGGSRPQEKGRACAGRRDRGRPARSSTRKRPPHGMRQPAGGFVRTAVRLGRANATPPEGSQDPIRRRPAAPKWPRRAGTFIRGAGPSPATTAASKTAQLSCRCSLVKPTSFFPVDDVGHDAVTTLERICRDKGRPYVPLRSASLASLITAFEGAEHLTCASDAFQTSSAAADLT